MQRIAFFLILLTGIVPLLRAWRANRSTSLIQAVHWALAAWLAWLLTLLRAPAPGTVTAMEPSRYLSLCLTGCAAVAVLGARRPQVGAWNFVVVGLLTVMLLPLAVSFVADSYSLGATLVGASLAMGILNYLPTRLAVAAIFLALGCGGELLVLAGLNLEPVKLEMIDFFALGLIILVPWIGRIAWQTGPLADNLFDRLWLDFRNRYGRVWAERVREQFNRSAANAGWTVYLYWQGLRKTSREAPPDLAAQGEMIETLQALLKRFVS